MMEFAMTCKYMMQRGWEFVDINYGERRLGVSTSLRIRRGAEEKTLYHYSDMEDLLRRECEEEERKKWEKPYESVRSDLSSPAG